jgi:hypothetical protein
MRYSFEELQRMSEQERQGRCRNAQRDLPTVVNLIADAKRRGDLEHAHELQSDLENIEETLRNCARLNTDVPAEK